MKHKSEINALSLDGARVTDGLTLTVPEDELGFWSGKPAFPLKEGNTETRCAWTDSSGYGIGLFTPGAEYLLAGRYEYDGSSDPKANSTNYVAPLGRFSLSFDEPYTYCCYITAGDINSIRGTFAQAAQAAQTGN